LGGKQNLPLGDAQPQELLETSPEATRGNKLKKFLISLGIAGLFAFTAAIAYNIKRNSIPENFKQYLNGQQYRISINYPENWSPKNIANAITGEVVQFISPPENNSDKFKENLMIIINPEDTTLEKYTKTLKERITTKNTDAKFIKEEEYTLANNQGYMVVYTNSQNNQKFKTMEVWTLKNFKAYSIIYSAEQNKYDKYMKKVEEMIRSFEINN
jgi:eukaryotic-like serine/threonine-protein kinase